MQGESLIRHLLTATLFVVGTLTSWAQPLLPPTFHAKLIHTSEAEDIFVRFGGTKPAVILIHGYAENSDSWGPLRMTY